MRSTYSEDTFRLKTFESKSEGNFRAMKFCLIVKTEMKPFLLFAGRKKFHDDVSASMAGKKSNYKKYFLQVYSTIINSMHVTADVRWTEL